jgi:hypothetical protein
VRAFVSTSDGTIVCGCATARGWAPHAMPEGPCDSVPPVPRRAFLLALPLAVAIGGCGHGTSAELTAQQERARVAFLKDHGDFDDHELAQLCPGLYPRDFLTDPDAYPEGKRTKGRTPPKVTAADRAQAKAAGCDVRP